MSMSPFGSQPASLSDIVAGSIASALGYESETVKLLRLANQTAAANTMREGRPGTSFDAHLAYMASLPEDQRWCTYLKDQKLCESCKAYKKLDNM